MGMGEGGREKGLERGGESVRVQLEFIRPPLTGTVEISTVLMRGGTSTE
jgi:hypothetical protein